MLNYALKKALHDTAAAAVTLLLVACGPNSTETFHGADQPLGASSIRSFVTLLPSGAPAAVGVEFSETALNELPKTINGYSRCHDVDGNGHHGEAECIGDYETVLTFPEEQIRNAALPFKWIAVNWNPKGHPEPAPAVYAEPHFDFHFYSWDRERVMAIAPGPCGELVDCEDFKRGSEAIDAEYLPPGHIDVGAVVAGMGNHLLDSQSPEMQPGQRFTRTFIYGAFDGELIFWEPMITMEFLKRTSAECYEIRMPQKVAVAGHYPSKYCIRHDTGAKKHTVSLEGFVYMYSGRAAESL